MHIAGITLAILAVSGMAAPASARCTLVKRGEMRVTMLGLVPTVQARINGTEVRLIADSGAFFNTLSPAAAAALKLHVRPAPLYLRSEGVGGEASRVSLATAATFTILELTVPKVDFLVAGPGFQDGVAGLLGQNVLRVAGDVEYDLKNAAIRLMRAEHCGKSPLAYWAGDNPWSAVDIERVTAESPLTTGTGLLNGSKIRITFDTGSPVSMLVLAAARRAGVTPRTPGAREAGTIQGMGRNPVRTWIAPFESFRIGAEEIRNTHLRFGDLGLGGTDMLLGADFFLSHRIYVANSQAKVYFTYNGGPVFDLKAHGTTDGTR